VLYDKEVSVSLLRGEVARRVISRLGRLFPLVKCTLALVTVSGSQLDIEGRFELDIGEMGSVSFVVVKSMNHQCILGWVHSCNGVMRLRGGKLYHIEGGSPLDPEPLEGMEAALVDAGYLNEVLTRHKGGVWRPSVLPAARLGAAHIKT